MRNSSYVAISLVSIILGIVTITPQIIYHRAAAAIPHTEPYITVELPSSSSAHAATTSEPAAIVAPVVPSAPKAQPKKRIIAQKSVPVTIPSSHMAQLRIPSIDLNSVVIPVGVNAKGEMDVPSGKTNHVGWYAGGVFPGEQGTAVMDAHVFAAFANLSSVKVGADVYVDIRDGRRLHFVVRRAETHLLSELTPQMLFQQTDGRHLNLITCAGNLTPDRSTYDHRLIVYTELVD